MKHRARKPKNTSDNTAQLSAARQPDPDTAFAIKLYHYQKTTKHATLSLDEDLARYEQNHGNLNPDNMSLNFDSAEPDNTGSLQDATRVLDKALTGASNNYNSHTYDLDLDPPNTESGNSS